MCFISAHIWKTKQDTLEAWWGCDMQGKTGNGCLGYEEIVKNGDMVGMKFMCWCDRKASRFVHLKKNPVATP